MNSINPTIDSPKKTSPSPPATAWWVDALNKLPPIESGDDLEDWVLGPLQSLGTGSAAGTPETVSDDVDATDSPRNWDESFADAEDNDGSVSDGDSDSWTGRISCPSVESSYAMLLNGSCPHALGPILEAEEAELDRTRISISASSTFRGLGIIASSGGEEGPTGVSISASMSMFGLGLINPPSCDSDTVVDTQKEDLNVQDSISASMSMFGRCLIIPPNCDSDTAVETQKEDLNDQCSISASKSAFGLGLIIPPNCDSDTAVETQKEDLDAQEVSISASLSFKGLCIILPSDTEMVVETPLATDSDARPSAKVSKEKHSENEGLSISASLSFKGLCITIPSEDEVVDKRCKVEKYLDMQRALGYLPEVFTSTSDDDNSGSGTECEHGNESELTVTPQMTRQVSVETASAVNGDHVEEWDEDFNISGDSNPFVVPEEMEDMEANWRLEALRRWIGNSFPHKLTDIREVDETEERPERVPVRYYNKIQLQRRGPIPPALCAVQAVANGRPRACVGVSLVIPVVRSSSAPGALEVARTALVALAV